MVDTKNEDSNLKEILLSTLKDKSTHPNKLAEEMYYGFHWVQTGKIDNRGRGFQHLVGPSRCIPLEIYCGTEQDIVRVVYNVKAINKEEKNSFGDSNYIKVLKEELHRAGWEYVGPQEGGATVLPEGIFDKPKPKYTQEASVLSDECREKLGKINLKDDYVINPFTARKLDELKRI